MKAKDLSKILLQNPEATVTLSVSSNSQQLFADKIIEVTDQGAKQITIVADLNEDCRVADVVEPLPTLDDEAAIELILTKYHGHTREQWDNELSKQYPWSELKCLVKMTWNKAQGK